jgi:hypothetical protein
MLMVETKQKCCIIYKRVLFLCCHYIHALGRLLYIFARLYIYPSNRLHTHIVDRKKEKEDVVKDSSLVSLICCAGNLLFIYFSLYYITYLFQYNIVTWLGHLNLPYIDG